MNKMGDMAEEFRELTAAKKERHSEWHKLNMAIMDKSGIEYEIKNAGEVLIIKVTSSKPQVQFWPSTGRWMARNITHSGGAKSFINWYNRQ